MDVRFPLHLHVFLLPSVVVIYVFVVSFADTACFYIILSQESSKRVEQVMSKCWKVWNGGRDPPAENEKAFKRLREKVRLIAFILTPLSMCICPTTSR